MGLWNSYAKLRQNSWKQKSADAQAEFDAKLAERRQPGATPVVPFAPGPSPGIELADREWERSRAEHQARLDGEVLGGPAGAYFWGTVPETLRPSEAIKAAGSVADEFKKSFRDLKETAATLADPKAMLGIGSEFGREIADPAQRAAVIDGERAGRDAARRPYLAPNRASPILTRIATRGDSQYENVAAYLAQTGLAGRPDLVYGVYRVPDRLDPKMPGSESGRVVEWDILHASTATLSPAPPPARMRFDGEERWVSRRKGEPTVLDEDLALSWMAAAGITPERCLGIAREVVMQASESWFGQSDLSNTSSDVYARVLGVSVFHTAGAAPAPRGPITVPFDGVAGTHVEVLNWAAVADAVHPRRHRAPETPSPFPYLPATPQEVLTAYLEIVGVLPADCFGAAVTIDEFSECGEIRTRREDQISWASLKLTDAAKLPCADGQMRRRLHGGTRIVISYRDTPAYREGRVRWLAYQRDVLFARLHHKTRARRPIADAYDDMGFVGSVLRRAEKISNSWERITSLRSNDPAYIRFRDQARYCTPQD